LYVCNNGGQWRDFDFGRIERVDLDSGTVEVLYTECAGRPLLGPNDLVFDRSGHFWFTDFGKMREHSVDYGRILYASIDGTEIVDVLPQLDTPNGIGLSPDESTLYWAESIPGRVFSRAITGPGTVAYTDDRDAASLLFSTPVGTYFDSLAIDADGNVCLATIQPGCITVVAPDGLDAWQYTLPAEFEDDNVTNICFGGTDLRTAYITLAGTGRLLACPWPTAGLPLAFHA
jgi:gluconolactonase